MDNRRMLTRVRPDDLTVLWCTPGTKVGARRESKRPPVARVLDISHTGMQLVAPADERIQRGTQLEVVIESITTPVRVRWLGPTNVEGVHAYGVEFLQMNRELEDLVIGIIHECAARDGVELPEPPPDRPPIW